MRETKEDRINKWLAGTFSRMYNNSSRPTDAAMEAVRDSPWDSKTLVEDQELVIRKVYAALREQ